MSAGLLVLGEMCGTEAACAVQTCDNYPGKQLDGCDCVCAPDNGRNCVLHLQSGSTYNCSRSNKG